MRKTLIPAFLAALFIATPLRAEEPKQPPPDPAARAKTLAEIKDLFKDDYAKKKPADLKDLAEKLLKQAGETKDDPATRFVLLAEAARVAAIAADLNTMADALAAVEQDYAVEAAADAAAGACKAAQTALAREAAVRRAVPVLEAAIAAGAFEPAEALYDAAWAAMKKSASRAAEAALDPFKEVALLKDEYARLTPAVLALKAKPNDPPANFAVGKFRCYRQGNWRDGIPLISKGSEPKLAALADRELNAPDAAEQAAIADGWWAVGEAEKGLSRHNVVRHALGLYRPVVDQLTGLAKARAEKRLEQERATNAQIINLLRLINPQRDAEQGIWVFDKGTLVSPNGAFDRVRIPYVPPSSYKLKAVVERKQGTESLAFGIVVSGHPCAAVLDGWARFGYRNGLEALDGKGVDNNESTVPGQVLPVGKKHQIECTVRINDVSVFVDGKKVFRWQGDPQRLSQQWKSRDPRYLFIGTCENVFLISKLELEPLPAGDR